ncbi:MAG: hypothetical protein LBO74_06765 [Candidatus Symbiothrix sp.]|jgi:hypothetical protein|nr:hypothetical protein [Candidatus Symbiothrix sp.]
MITLQEKTAGTSNMELPYGVELDEKGYPVGITVEEWFDKLDRKLINHYGEEYRKLANTRRASWNKKSLGHFDFL